IQLAGSENFLLIGLVVESEEDEQRDNGGLQQQQAQTAAVAPHQLGIKGRQHAELKPERREIQPLAGGRRGGGGGATRDRGDGAAGNRERRAASGASSLRFSSSAFGSALAGLVSRRFCTNSWCSEQAANAFSQASASFSARRS